MIFKQSRKKNATLSDHWKVAKRHLNDKCKNTRRKANDQTKVDDSSFFFQNSFLFDIKKTIFLLTRFFKI